MSEMVRVESPAARSRLQEAAEHVRAVPIPGSAEEVDDGLLEEVAHEIIGYDSQLAGAIDTLVAGGEVPRRFLAQPPKLQSLLEQVEADGLREEGDRLLAYAALLRQLRDLADALAR